MEVRWSIPAAGDLEHICEWIERDNPEAAHRVARTIYDECARLKNFPISDGPVVACPDGVNLPLRLGLTSSSIG